MMMFKNYDAVHDFRHEHGKLVCKLVAEEGKPRTQAAIRERLHTIQVLFAAFINHALAVKFPDHNILFFDTAHAEQVLRQLPPGLLGHPLPVNNLDAVWAMFDFDVKNGEIAGLISGPTVHWTFKKVGPVGM